jgi:hypothetical protein
MKKKMNKPNQLFSVVGFPSDGSQHFMQYLFDDCDEALAFVSSVELMDSGYAWTCMTIGIETSAYTALDTHREITSDI